MIRRISCALSVILLGACTAVSINNTNPHVETPELRGDRGLLINAQTVGGHYYQTSDDGSQRPPIFSHPETFASFDPGGGVMYEPSLPVAIGLQLQASGAAAVAKVQLNGSGTRHAQAGEWPIAIYGRVGAGYSQASGNQQELFGPGGYNWKSTMDALYVQAGASAGYRFSQRALLYWGVAAGQYWNRTEIDQDTNSSDDPSPGGVYKNGDTGTAVTDRARPDVLLAARSIFCSSGMDSLGISRGGRDE